MKKILLFVLMYVCVPIGAWAATTDLKNDQGQVVARLTVDGNSAVLEVIVANASISYNDKGQLNNLKDVKVTGYMPQGIFNVDQYNNGLRSCTRLDLSEVTDYPSGNFDLSQNSSISGLILPSNADFSAINSSSVKYIIKSNTGDSEPNAVEVCVKSGTSWANDPIVQDASYLKVYGSDGTNYLEDCAELRALNQTKWVNEEPAKQVLEDLTINANEQDEQEVLTNFLVTEGKVIKNLTVTGELADLAMFDGISVTKDVDFSGITNSDLSTLKLPSTTGTVKLPGGSYKEGIVTLADDYTQDQLKNIVAVLKGSDKSVNEIIFPGGSVYNTNTKALEVTTDDEDNGKLSSIATDLRNADLDIESVKLEKYGTSWKGETMTLPTSSSAQEESQKTLLSNAGFPVNKVKKTSYPDIEVELVNGVLTITSYREGALQEMLNSSDEEANAYKALIQDNSAKGEGSKLVLVGPFKADDLSKLTQQNNATESVDMSNTTFSNYSDMKFSYWGTNLKKAVTSNNIPGDVVISQEAFNGCTQLSEVTFNSGKIGGKVLGNNDSDHAKISKITIGSGVTELMENAFYKCSTASLDWANATSLTSIGASAFFECAGITGVLTIPNSVTTIGEKAFEACNGIQAIIIGENSNLQSIASRAFWMSEDDATRNLKNVFVMKTNGTIECALDAFDYTSTYGQTGVGRVTTRLWYPPQYYEYYVGSYKEQFIHGDQNDINLMQQGAANGFQKFISTGIPTQGKDYWRTYCDVVPLKVPAGFPEGAPVTDLGTNVYLVYGYDKTTNNALLVKMKEGDVIPAWTGVVIHYHVLTDQSSVIYFDKYDGEGYTGRYDAQYYEDSSKAQYHNTDSLYRGTYMNYLRALNTYGYKQRIENVEKVNGVKTYRNFFFGNGSIINAKGSVVLNENGDYVSGAKGIDWDKYYSSEYNGWGFFRAVSANYNISSKAYLHYPAKDGFPGVTSGLMNNDLSQVVSSAKSCGFIITYLDDEIEDFSQGIATKIENVDSSNNVNDYIYTLQGVKVKTPEKIGIYIKNGKKYIIK